MGGVIIVRSAWRARFKIGQEGCLKTNRKAVASSAITLLLLLSSAVFLEADVVEVKAAKDKTPPTGSIVINGGAEYTSSVYVTLTLTANDPESGVGEVRYSNTGVWKPWERFSATKMWTLTSGDGVKTVYYQIRNNDNLVSETYSDSIILSTAVPTPTPSPTPSPSPSPTPSPTLTPSPTPSPTASPIPSPTPTPKGEPTPTSFPSPTGTPTPVVPLTPLPTSNSTSESPRPTPTLATTPSPSSGVAPTTAPTATPSTSSSSESNLQPAEANFSRDDWRVIGVLIVLVNGVVLIFLSSRSRR